MSANLGTFNREAVVTITVVNAGSPPPSPEAVKIGTDTESNKDLYTTVAYSWVSI